VDQPAGPLDACTTVVEEFEPRSLAYLVLRHAKNVNQVEELVFRYLLLVLGDVAITKGRGLSLLTDQEVFIDTVVSETVSILYVKLTFFVHVEYPGMFVSGLSARSLVQGPSFEERVEWGDLV